jgi:phosphoserine phosphatase
MMRTRRILGRLAALTAVLSGWAAPAAAQDPLPSWNEGATKQAILTSVKEATTPGRPGFIPAAERIATFDNDGTLWVEQPIYTQLAFALDRVKTLAPQHPEWKTEEPFASLLQGDLSAALAGGEHAVLEIIMATHAGMSTTQFEKIVRDWLATATHPRFKRPYTELVYQPMLELLAYLRANGFKTYIVSGGGVEFMRPWTETVYGIPPEQVIGSRIKTSYQMTADGPVLMREAGVDFIDDKSGKPLGINAIIGRRPMAAFGNSDGDRQMLEWVPTDQPRLRMLVHHDDATREYAYGPKSHVGTFSDSLMAQARASGWTVISMKNDWKRVFGFESR